MSLTELFTIIAAFCAQAASQQPSEIKWKCQDEMIACTEKHMAEWSPEKMLIQCWKQTRKQQIKILAPKKSLQIKKTK